MSSPFSGTLHCCCWEVSRTMGESSLESSSSSLSRSPSSMREQTTPLIAGSSSSIRDLHNRPILTSRILSIYCRVGRAYYLRKYRQMVFLSPPQDPWSFTLVSERLPLAELILAGVLDNLLSFPPGRLQPLCKGVVVLLVHQGGQAGSGLKCKEF